MSPVNRWAQAVVRIGRRFAWVELELALNQFRRYGRCDLGGWQA